MGSNHSTPSSKKQGSSSSRAHAASHQGPAGRYHSPPPVRTSRSREQKKWEKKWEKERQEQIQRAQRAREISDFLGTPARSGRDGHQVRPTNTNTNNTNNNPGGLHYSSRVKFQTPPEARQGSRREQMLSEQAAEVARSRTWEGESSSYSSSSRSSGWSGTTATSQTAPSGPRYLVDPNKNKGTVKSRFHEEF